MERPDNGGVARFMKQIDREPRRLVSRCGCEWSITVTAQPTRAIELDRALQRGITVLMYERTLESIGNP